jgi:nicotinamidase-related amidase
LFVPGADQDAERLSEFVNRMSKNLGGVHVTLDSHRSIQIFFESFWVDSKGGHPSPFTIISVDDVEKGRWKCFNPSWQGIALNYVRQLAKNGRYPLCVWPYHTIIGSIGAALVPSFSDAIIKWEKDNFAFVDYVTKGSNVMTENYSIYKADVVDPADSLTMPNTDLLAILQSADEILIAGEALSHCVANSVTDICTDFGEENIKKIVLLRDTTSNVTGFENLGNDFVKNMSKRGMRVTTSVDYLA